MSKRLMSRFVTQAFKGVTLICFVTYLLQPLDKRFLNIFIASIIILIWLLTATVVLFLERLLYGDEG